MLVSLALLISLQVPSAPPSEAEAVQRAKAAHARGDYREAIRWLEQADRLHPRPIYAFNKGRAHEKLGELREAHSEFLRTRAHPDVDAELRKAAEARAASLKPFIDKVLLTLRDLPGGALAQLDDALVADPDTERTLGPGWHQLCLLSAAQDQLRCWRRNLPPGRRVSWPPRSRANTRASVLVGGTRPLARLVLDGQQVRLAVGKLRAIELDIGERAVGLTWAGREPLIRQTITVEPGGRLELAAAVEVPREHRDITGPVVLSSSGAAVLAAGVTLLVLGLSDRADLEDQQRNADGVITSITQPEARDGFEKADAMTVAGSVLTGAGAAALIAGVVWLVVSGDDDPRPGVVY